MTIFSDDDDDKFNWWLILIVWSSTLLVTSTLLSSTKKRTLFSRLPLSEPTINAYGVLRIPFSVSSSDCSHSCQVCVSWKDLNPGPDSWSVAAAPWKGFLSFRPRWVELTFGDLVFTLLPHVTRAELSPLRLSVWPFENLRKVQNRTLL